MNTYFETMLLQKKLEDLKERLAEVAEVQKEINRRLDRLEAYNRPIGGR